MRRTHAERLAAGDGYFPPDSVMRRLGNAPVTPLLGGGAAVLLQVAHPLVAAGVVEHSGYDRDLWRRLIHTMRALYLVAFGDREEAEEAGAAVRAAHKRVRGTTAAELGPFPAGTPYSAADPDLMLWVHATLVHSSLAAYERFVTPLSPAERERYYGEMAVMAELFGTPPGVLPPTYDDFCDYFDAQIASDTITVTEPAREVAAVILATPLPAPLRVLAPAHRLATTCILPPRLRREYGLRWSPLERLAMPFASRTVRYGTRPALTVAARLPISVPRARTASPGS
jgi:uncharacterized protein (DUF2236 family)